MKYVVISVQRNWKTQKATTLRLIPLVEGETDYPENSTIQLPYTQVVRDLQADKYDLFAGEIGLPQNKAGEFDPREPKSLTVRERITQENIDHALSKIWEEKIT